MSQHVVDSQIRDSQSYRQTLCKRDTRRQAAWKPRASGGTDEIYFGVGVFFQQVAY